ncbi:hypothetical protein Z045_05900 [Rhodococcus pyridinivorans KG-16]|uniref:Uncharacterized protein n=1 Tax=Rhodococcus pyridinivorans KG-16 TaxID=1441730 RepID=A0A0V9UNX0_9NOCA|nr:hypothetical protein [Rhodococcus pyridinivorans]KSZ59699.1 hypothetical protein Z045_05900 [Rhodococcus pyridinivorans KG-16]
MTERLTTYREHDIPTPLPEYVETEDQLVIGHERDFLELQTPQMVREIGAYALRRAQELIELASECEAVLVDWDMAEKSRAKKIDVTSRLRVFERGDE